VKEAINSRGKVFDCVHCNQVLLVSIIIDEVKRLVSDPLLGMEEAFLLLSWIFVVHGLRNDDYKNRSIIF
jgi:hypothetical protein